MRRSATFQIPKYKVIPAHFSRTHTAPRPVHPRALREASFSGTGSRWPRTGATGTPNARRSKPHGPSRQVRHCQYRTPISAGTAVPLRCGDASPRHGTALVSRLQQYVTVTKTGTNRCHAASRCTKSRLARMERLRYHSSAIIDEDRKANRGDKKLMAGRHRKLMNMSAGGDRWGESRRRNVGKKNRGRRPQLNLKRFFST